MKGRRRPRLDSRPRSIVGGLLVFVIFGAVGVAASMMVREIAEDSLRAREWVTVPATVVDASLAQRKTRKGGTVFQARATYLYSWQGREYTSSRLDGTRLGGFDNLGGWQEEIAAKLEAARASETTIPVFVNPADPSEAMVDRSIRFVLVAVFGLFAVMFGGASLLGLYLALKGPKGLGTGLMLEWGLGLAWTIFSLTMLAIAVVAGSWIGAVVLFVFLTIGVLILWSCVEKTFPPRRTT